MSKLDVGVGDEFPLDEGDDHASEDHRRPGFHGHHRHGHRHAGHEGNDHDHYAHHHMMHGHRRHFHALPLLLILGGVAALIVAGKIPVAVAYAMIGLGLLAVLAMVFFGARHVRRHHRLPQ